MNIKELKEAINSLPDEAEALFGIWGLEGDKHTLFQLKGGNNMQHKTENGGIAVIIGTADNCRAHKMVRKGDILVY